jgi:hypothetical protein
MHSPDRGGHLIQLGDLLVQLGYIVTLTPISEPGRA